MKKSILFVDNNDDARSKWGKYLREAGFHVHLAGNPHEAITQLESGRVDLAVIDIRLLDDDLETDLSGIELAIEPRFRHIPKIILSGFALSYEDQRKVWNAFGGEPPAVVAFISKGERPQVILEEINRAFEIWPHLNMLSSKVSDQIKADHNTVRMQAKWNYALALMVSLFGFCLIVTGIVLAWEGGLPVGLVGTFSGIMVEAIGYLFFTQLEHSRLRMDIYHQELLQTYGIEFLVSVAERLPAEDESDTIKQLLKSAIKNWYPETGGDNLVRGKK